MSEVYTNWCPLQLWPKAWLLRQRACQYRESHTCKDYQPLPQNQHSQTMIMSWTLLGNLCSQNWINGGWAFRLVLSHFPRLLQLKAFSLRYGFYKDGIVSITHCHFLCILLNLDSCRNAILSRWSNSAVSAWSSQWWSPRGHPWCCTQGLRTREHQCWRLSKSECFRTFSILWVNLYHHFATKGLAQVATLE